MMKKKDQPKLLLIAPYFFPRNYGGAVKIYHDLMRSLQNFNITVLSESQGIEQNKIADFDNTSIEKFNYSMIRMKKLVLHFTSSNRILNIFETLSFLFSSIIQFYRIIKFIKPDIIICGDTFSCGWFIQIVSNKITKINYIHGEEITQETYKGRFVNFLKRYQKIAINKANLNIVPSSFTKEMIIKFSNVRSNKILVMPNFIDTKKFYPLKNREKIRKKLSWSNKIILLTIARLVPRKGVDKVLLALNRKQGNGELPNNWKYVIGGKGEEKKKLQALCKQLNLENHVDFIGFVEDDKIRELYGAADVFVMTNREINGDTEGFGIVFLEANACGTPVIGGIAGGTKDAIKDKITGLRVDGNDVNEIGDAIIHLLNHEKTRKFIGNEGIKNVIKNHSIKIASNKFNNILLLLNKRKYHSLNTFNNMKSKVSIIIPTYNMAKYLPQAIDSIFAQTYENYEVIVIDDGSTDNTKQILNKYKDKIKYIYQKNKGLACARNLGVKNSKGTYIALLDADDAWLPNKLSEEVPILDNNLQIGLVHTNAIEIDEEGNTIGLSTQSPRLKTKNMALNLLLRKEHILCLTVLFRKDCLKYVGMFDEKLTWLGVEDRDLWVRIAQHFRIEYINKPLALHRIRSDAMSRNLENMMKARYYIVDKYCPKSLGMKVMRKRMLSAIHFEVADGLSWRGKPRRSLIQYWKALKFYPFNIIIYINFVKAITKTIFNVS